jgi:hypothetical protein
MSGSLRNIMKGLSRSMVYNEVMGIGVKTRRVLYCCSFFFKVYYYRPTSKKKISAVQRQICSDSGFSLYRVESFFIYYKDFPRDMGYGPKLVLCLIPNKLSTRSEDRYTTGVNVLSFHNFNDSRSRGMMSLTRNVNVTILSVAFTRNQMLAQRRQKLL